MKCGPGQKAVQVIFNSNNNSKNNRTFNANVDFETTQIRTFVKLGSAVTNPTSYTHISRHPQEKLNNGK